MTRARLAAAAVVSTRRPRPLAAVPGGRAAAVLPFKVTVESFGRRCGAMCNNNPAARGAAVTVRGGVGGHGPREDERRPDGRAGETEAGPKRKSVVAG